MYQQLALQSLHCIILCRFITLQSQGDCLSAATPWACCPQRMARLSGPQKSVYSHLNGYRFPPISILSTEQPCYSTTRPQRITREDNQCWEIVLASESKHKQQCSVPREYMVDVESIRPLGDLPRSMSVLPVSFCALTLFLGWQAGQSANS